MQVDKATLEFMYFKKSMTQKQIGEEIGLPQNRVSYYFKKLNIKARRTWNENDLEYLEEKYGLVSINSIAKKLNKTPYAVSIKAKRLGLGGVLNATEYLNSAQLADALNVDRKTALRWIKVNGLKATFKTIGMERKFYRINLSDFWKWAESHKQMIRWQRVEMNALGKEPKWLKKVRHEDSKKPGKRIDKWSAKEDDYLTMYWNDNKPIDEIARNLKRTNAGVLRRAKRIGLKRRKVSLPFKAVEDVILIRMKTKGYKDSEIAEELGRSTDSVSWRRKTLMKNGQLEWKYQHNKKVTTLPTKVREVTI